MSTTEVVIVAARRTPIGAFQGVFGKTPAIHLGGTAIAAAVADAGIAGEDVGEVIMGCVLPAGIGQAPARQAALDAGLPLSTPCTTINKVCGSGAKTIMQGMDAIRSGAQKIVVAGGMESMSCAPYLLPKVRSGMRMGHGELLDHMFFDGLQSPFDGNMMGHFGEQTARRYGFTREQQDAFATVSVERARAAENGDAFRDEIAPVVVHDRTVKHTVIDDEEPARIKLQKIPSLRPAFAKDGTVTAASSSKISDGAAALVLMSRDEAERRGITPLATLVEHSAWAQEPEWFTTAPIGAIQKLGRRTGWEIGDVDLFEINEAFAVVTMAAIHDLALDPEKVNVNGGACALGHPIGCTGARLVVTLVHALRKRGLKRGIASQCIGGGEATAIAVQVDG